MAAYIPGIINVEADAESRMSKTKTEWKLNEPCFHSILSHFRGNPSGDLFALRVDDFSHIAYLDPVSKCQGYQRTCQKLESSCSFLLLSCIGKYPKIISNKVTGIPTVPNWPNQS